MQIKINGVTRNIITGSITGRFTVDSDSLPGRPCAEHRLTQEAAAHIARGGAVRTSGNRYEKV